MAGRKRAWTDPENEGFPIGKKSKTTYGGEDDLMFDSGDPNHGILEHIKHAREDQYRSDSANADRILTAFENCVFTNFNVIGLADLYNPHTIKNYFETYLMEFGKGIVKAHWGNIREAALWDALWDEEANLIRHG